MRYTFLYGDDEVPTFDIANRLADKWEERVTCSPKFIDTDHAYIHEGIAYDAWFNGSISSTYHFQFSTPTTLYVHLRPTAVAVSGGSAIFRVFMTGTGTATPVSGGSTFTPVNKKYTSTQASEVTFNTGINTSSTADYTLKYEASVFGGSGGNTRIGSALGNGLEWILVPDRDYVFTVTPSSAMNIGVNLFWYEEANA